MISLTELENEFKSAATKAGIEVHQLLLALAHFSQTAVPVLTTAADIAETATGNAELVPITNAVSATVQATGATILSQSSTVSQLGTVYEEYEPLQCAQNIRLLFCFTNRVQ